MIIVGLTGKIRHGKTTFADMLAAQAISPEHLESWQIIAEVASYMMQSGLTHPLATDIAAINHYLTLLPEAIATCVHVTVSYEEIKITPNRLAKHPEYYQKLFEYLRTVESHPELASAELTADNKEQFRSLLQWLGGYLVAVKGGGIWYDEIVRRIAYLNSLGNDLAIVGGVRYPGDAERLRNAGGIIIDIQRPNQPTLDATDLTERDRNLIKADTVIRNNAGLAELEQVARIVFNDLKLRELQPVYEAAAPAATAM